MLPIRLAAEKIKIELACLGDIENSQDRNGPRETYCHKRALRINQQRAADEAFNRRAASLVARSNQARYGPRKEPSPSLRGAERRSNPVLLWDLGLLRCARNDENTAPGLIDGPSRPNHAF